MTTLVIGKIWPSRCSSGFSLLEIILTLALIASVTSLFVTGATGILGGIGERSPEDTLLKAVREARFLAADTGQRVRLSYDKDNQSILLGSEAGARLASFPLKTAKESSLELTFLRVLPARGLESMERHRLRDEETLEIVFMPDRSSTPFRVRLKEPQYDRTLDFDSFSSIAEQRS